MEPDPSAPARYRLRETELEAVQYQPHANCAAVAAFVGSAAPIDCMPDDGPSELPWQLEDAEGRFCELEPGDWAVKDPAGGVRVYSDTQFRRAVVTPDD